jgi:hypothetical protein
VPVSLLIEVIDLFFIPQGTIYSNSLKSFDTFRANPCEVTHLEQWKPIAQIFLLSSIQTPVSPDKV